MGLVALVALVALGACSKAAPPDEGVATLADPGTTSTTAAGGAGGGVTKADEPKLREFSKCMRENGNPDMPDPKFTADGKLDLTGFINGDVDFTSPDFQTGLQACRDKLAGVNIGAQSIDQTKILDAAVTFTGCLRANGFPDVKDPTADQLGGGNGGPPSLPPGQPGDGGILGKDRIARQAGLDPKDPKVQAAMDVCHPALVKSITQAIGG